MKKINIWPLNIIIFFSCFFCAIVVFAVVISGKRFDLVSPDYYDEEIAYQGRIDSITRAKALEAPPHMTLEGQHVRVAFPVDYAGRVEDGKVHLYRPSDARQDVVEPLALDSVGAQLVSISGRPKGLWQARLSWQMDGESYYFEEPLVVKGP